MFTLDIVQFASIENKSSHSFSWSQHLNERLIMQVIVFSGVNHIIIHDHSRTRVYCLSKQNVSYKISINVLFYVNDYAG